PKAIPGAIPLIVTDRGTRSTTSESHSAPEHRIAPRATPSSARWTLIGRARCSSGLSLLIDGPRHGLRAVSSAHHQFTGGREGYEKFLEHFADITRGSCAWMGGTRPVRVVHRPGSAGLALRAARVGPPRLHSPRT